MKRSGKTRLFLFLLMIRVFCMPVISSAKETVEMTPVYGEDIAEGSYEVEVESSSSMFRVVKARLQVADGDMEAVLTLSGVGYLKLFMGTGEEALNAGEDSFIPYMEDAEGKYTYTIPVEALDQEFDCAAFSKRKQKWYDRTLVVLSSSLPENALKKPADTDAENSSAKNSEELRSEKEPAENPEKIGSEKSVEAIGIEIEAEDGDYTIEITLDGGSGRATVISPAHVHISERKAVALLEWSSPYYDYMYVGGNQYFPVNTEGNSIFEIPVLKLDEEMDVTADTTAMSTPHEIEYKLTFHADTLKKEADDHTKVIVFVAAAVVIAAVIAGTAVKRKKKVTDA